MTLFFPDVNEYKDVSLAGIPFVEIRASIGDERDVEYERYANEADSRKIPWFAYHFLNHSAVGTGSPEAQADFAFSVVGTRAPLMLDTEPNRGYDAPVSEGVRFVNRYRGHGGILKTVYKPKWSWEGQGYPSLQPFVDLGLGLVASNYTGYSDTGPGWSPYGGFNSVLVWQYTETGNLNGQSNIDWNAFRGTLDDLKQAVGLISSTAVINSAHPFFYDSQNNN